MKFMLSSYGSRGDVEPCAAVGRELLRRGHDVRIAVPTDLVGFVEAVGLPAVAFGPNLQWFVHAQQELWNNHRNVRDRAKVVLQARELLAECWRETSATLKPLVDGAHLLITGSYLEESAANIAEYYGIPLATLHTFPMRSNGQRKSMLPSPMIRCAMTANEWALYWQFKKKTYDAHRRQLGLPKAIGPSSRRMAKSTSLEIQAYDEVCFPGLSTEWEKCSGRRPFVGALTMELATDANREAASWIASGPPPICFCFGSMPVESPADAVKMISSACAELGERALICAGWSDFSGVPPSDHIKVVGALNYASVFPACRAVVHHGGSGTTAASLRAGVPTLILWTWPEQPLWGTQVTRLGVGSGRGFSNTSCESLVADLRQILAPECIARARELAARMTKPAESVGQAADLVENFAGAEPIGREQEGCRC